jgi:signal transduction histidine kinase/ligand-binding sensor domain-containing protein
LKAQKTSSSKELSLYFDQPEVLKKAGVNNVRCIFKDSRKLMWIGTDNGLFRYDGTNVIYQRHKPGDSTSIPDNKIASIKEDKIGNIWLGTLAGVACMNPYNFKCKVYRNELHNLSGNFDNKILIGPTGEIWTGNSEGLFLLDKKASRFKKVWKDILPGKPVSAYITSLLYWKPDTLVLGTFNNIVFINTRNFGFKRIAPLNTDILVDNLWKDAGDNLWIGTWSDGCLITDTALTKFQQYKWEHDLPSGVDNVAFSFAETITNDTHDIWIGTNTGLSKIPITSSNRIDLTHAKTYTSGINRTNNDPGNIGYLWADEEHYLWTGSSSGISKFYAGQNLFHEVPINIKGSVENIQPITIAQKNYLAISSWHGPQGIVFWNGETNTTSIIDSIDKHDQFGSNISGVAVDKHNRLWLASLSGVFSLNDHFKITTSLSKSKNKEDIPSGKKTNDILINNDTVWISCYKNGLDLYSLHLHKLKHFIDHDGSGLADNLIERLYKDRRGNVWLCGNSYFYKYQPSTASFKKFDFSIEHAGHMTHDVTETSDGHLIIATEIGLIYFDPVTEFYQFIRSPMLEKEESVFSVASDINNNIWYLTSNHLVQYQPQSKKFTLFGEEDGLNTNGLQLLRCFDGKQIFLAEEGRLLHFSTEQWQKKISAPQILLHSIQVNDSIVQSAQPLHELHLHYNQNKIYFEFDGITYTKPEQNLYAYKLTGVDKYWIISNKNSVSYANLSPGHYHFYVKTANYTGAWSKEYKIDIFIAPPFWLTWWFIALAVLAIGSLFVFVIRYISQRNLREKILRLEKEQAIEKERNRIARDMHDDLGSGLTKIAILSEVAKTQLQQKEIVTLQLENISYSSRELVDNLQNIIWVLNPKNDSLENLSAYVREYALKFFDSTNVDVHFNYPQQIPSIKLSEEQRRNIFMVIKETLNNIAKHSCCNTIFIELTIDKKQLQVKIKDDGKGFEIHSARQFANGLNNMKQRMDQVNGSYEITSALNEGTVTTLTVPL